MNPTAEDILNNTPSIGELLGENGIHVKERDWDKLISIIESYSLLKSKEVAYKAWEAAMKRAIHILEPTDKIVPDKETFMKELFKDGAEKESKPKS